MIEPQLPGAKPPDWYGPMQACRYLGVPFHEVERVPWPIVRQWAMAAQQAEAEADAVLVERARAK